MVLIDSHCHLDQVDDIDGYIERAKQHGVEVLLAVGASRGLESNFETFNLVKNKDQIFCAFGIHPFDADQGLNLESLNELLNDPKAVAVGETGLDKSYKTPFKAQIELFLDHIELARIKKKPLIIHCRHAYKEVLQYTINFSEPIIFHCFTGSTEDLKQILSRDNTFVSYSGIVTFKKSEALCFTVKKTPINRLLIETDAPYLSPVPYRGKKCESWMVSLTAKFIAELIGINFVDFVNITKKNFEEAFRVNVGG